MKHVLLLIFLSLFSYSFLSAQAFHKGQLSISPGAMFGNWGPYTGGSTVPLMASAEIGLGNLLGIGPFAGMARYRYEDKEGQYGWDFQSFGLRADIHFLSLIEDLLDEPMNSDQVDLYVGALAGYELASFTANDDRPISDAHPDGRFIVNAMAGGRYYLTKHIAIYGEAGFILYGVFNAGITLRIP